MKRIVKHGLSALVALVVFTPAPMLHGQEKEKSPPTRRDFMRQKLEFSKQLLEGLTTENYQSLGKDAKALRRLSQAAEWEVPTIPNATEYVTFTAEFQRHCDELTLKSKEKNIDGATLAYLKITMNCVNCHKYVRFVAH